MTTKQEKLYKNILLEVYNSGIVLNHKGFRLEPLKSKPGKLSDKIMSYHTFFVVMSGKIPKGKLFSQINNAEYNAFLETVRVILSDNSYTLKIDEALFDRAIKDSKKITEFEYFLK